MRWNLIFYIWDYFWTNSHDQSPWLHRNVASREWCPPTGVETAPNTTWIVVSSNLGSALQDCDGDTLLAMRLWRTMKQPSESWQKITDQLTKGTDLDLDHMYARDEQYRMEKECQWVRAPHLGESWRVRHRWNIRMYWGRYKDNSTQTSLEL